MICALRLNISIPQATGNATCPTLPLWLSSSSTLPTRTDSDKFSSILVNIFINIFHQLWSIFFINIFQQFWSIFFINSGQYFQSILVNILINSGKYSWSILVNIFYRAQVYNQLVRMSVTEKVRDLVRTFHLTAPSPRASASSSCQRLSFCLEIQITVRRASLSLSEEQIRLKSRRLSISAPSPEHQTIHLVRASTFFRKQDIYSWSFGLSKDFFVK